MRIAPLIFILFFISTELSAQSIKGTLSPSNILIGDQAQVTVLIQAQGRKVSDLLLNDLKGENGVELVEPGEMIYDASSDQYTQILLVTSFDSGIQYVPEIGAIVESSYGFIDTIYTNKIPIKVQIVLPDSLGLAPVKNIIEEDKIWTDYLIFLLPILGILLVVLVLFLWRKRKQKITTDLVEPIIPAHIEALTSLEELENSVILENGDIKIYESRISSILRKYLERQFGFPALEWTTREIIGFFKDEKWQQIPSTLIYETLSLSDLVKFAKSAPGLDSHRRQADHVRKIILLTKDLISEEE